MGRWTYDISRHSLAEIVQMMRDRGYDADGGSQVLFCDTQGRCFFDEAPDPYEMTIKDILNARGRDGWELVQITFREREFICFWKRSGEGD